jgi:cation diffusion facilitator CzcD-associated flavoprotein CzcO
MAHVIVIGAGLGGIPAAFDLRKHLAKRRRVTLIGARPYFAVTPAWRTLATRASHLLGYRQFRRATSRGPRRANGSTLGKLPSKNISCARSAPDR